MHLFSPLSAIACAVVLLSACTETTAVAPAARPLPGLPIAASMTQLAAATHPNSEKYRDSGFRPATGSSGSATVSVRALLDKAGTTDVEVTTGTFDEASAPGSQRSLSNYRAVLNTYLHTRASSARRAPFPSSACEGGQSGGDGLERSSINA